MIRRFRKVAAILACSMALSVAPIDSLTLAQPASREMSRTLSFRQILRRIFRDDEERDPPTISRGGVCLVTPVAMGGSRTIWNNQPVFVWKGAIAQLKVIDAVTEAVLWDYRPTLRETQVTYAGESLKGNRRYRWQVFSVSNLAVPQGSSEFEILPAPTRWLINNGLSAAEQSAATVAGSSQESIVRQAAARAQYFVARDLAPDAVQALFLVDVAASQETTSEPVAELSQARQEILDKVCGL